MFLSLSRQDHSELRDKVSHIAQRHILSPYGLVLNDCDCIACNGVATDDD